MKWSYFNGNRTLNLFLPVGYFLSRTVGVQERKKEAAKKQKKKQNRKKKERKTKSRIFAYAICLATLTLRGLGWRGRSDGEAGGWSGRKIERERERERERICVYFVRCVCVWDWHTLSQYKEEINKNWITRRGQIPKRRRLFLFM